MRIIIVVDTFPSPSETFISNKVRYLADKGIIVYIFCTHSNKSLLNNLFGSYRNVKVILLHKWKIFPFMLTHPFSVIKSILKEKNVRKSIYRKHNLYSLNKYSPDIIHFEFSGIGVDYLYEIKRLSCKKVVSCRGSAEKVKLLIYEERKKSFRLLLNSVDAIHCVSEDMRNTILPYCSNPDKIFINYPSIDTNYFHKRYANNKREEVVNILSVGRLTFQKGFATGLHAAYLLKQSGIAFRWTIVGTGVNYEEIIYQRNFLQLDDCVTLVGAKSSSEVKNLMEQADIFLLPSIYEGIANVALEAMSMEVPVVATRSGGMEEVIEHGKNGLLANVYDHEGIAENLLLLLKDESLRKVIGSKGRLTIEQKFTLQIQANKYLEVYGQLAATCVADNLTKGTDPFIRTEQVNAKNIDKSKTKLNIGLILPQFPALSETFFINKVLGLCQRGHNVVVFGSRASDDKFITELYGMGKYKNLHVVNLDFKRSPWQIFKVFFSHPKAFFASLRTDNNSFRGRLHINLCRAYTNQYACDIYHFGYSGTAIFYTNLFDHLKGKTVISCRGTAENVKLVSEKDRGEKLRILFDKVDRIHCVSVSMSETVQTYGAPPEKIFVNHPAIDTVFFERSKPYCNKKQMVILSIVRLVFQKGFALGMLAVQQLKEKFPHFVWKIVGDGGEMEELMSHINALNLKSNVQLLGKKNRDEIKVLYEEADIYFLPSVSEGLANAVLEAMAMELPVVSSDVGGMPEAITDNIDGKLCKNYDYNDMAAQLYELCINFDLRKRLGYAAKDTARRRFDITRYIDVFEEQYYQLVN